MKAGNVLRGDSARRLIGASIATSIALVLGVAAAWPIYRSPWLWLVAAVALVLGVGFAVLRPRLRLPIFIASLLGMFALTVVPVAVPQALENLPDGLIRGLGNGLAAVALSWKQLLTLTLPVGTYQTMLVPVYLVFLLTALATAMLALRSWRVAAFAAVPLVAPVAFGTVFGASAVSDPLRFGPLVITAPRELALWLAAATLGAVWVAWSAGAERRAALRRGGVTISRSRLMRGMIAAGTLVLALVAGLVFAPAVGAGTREVPRDRVDPEIVVRDQASPLASYRTSKQDSALDRELLAVTAKRGTLPHHLRLSVLDAYDGVDFHVSADAAGRFTRFPSGAPLRDPAEITVKIGEGYREIWVPAALLGDPPRFAGDRAADLADAFYVNRETNAAIVVPGGRGFAPGDGYRATVETATSEVAAQPASPTPLFDVSDTPELAAWIKTQNVSTNGDGLVELIERLRARGYLSHSISEADTQWLAPLAEEYGTRFESSAGGHSLARIELLFAQLNAQQASAGEDAKDSALVAGIGDDEQFATAAALIARALGFESRVVVGVRLDPGSAGAADAGVPGIPACAESCSGQNLAAWIEVRGESGDWAALDVTPQVKNPPQTLEEGEQLPEFPTMPEEHEAHEVDPPLGMGDQNEAADDPVTQPTAFWLWPVLKVVGLSLLGLLFLAVPFLFLPLAKRLRRNKRRSDPHPELRALGAWQEMIDTASDAGVRVRGGASRREIGQTLATAPAIWAAWQVDRAVFSPESLSDADADMVWAAADADRGERRQQMTRWQRLRAAYSLRSYGLVVGTRRARSGESLTDGIGPSDRQEQGAPHYG